MPGSTPNRFDVVAMGELVVDLIPANQDSDEPLFAARPGGAPGNVAAGVARLGLRAAMQSRVGTDPFGDLLLRALGRAGVATGAVRRAVDAPTALAVVALDAQGERDFTLHRAGSADVGYAPADVDLGMVRAARLLHVGSLWLGTASTAAAQRRAVAAARKAGILVSADPNLRPAAWTDPEAMLAAGREAIAGADIVKLSEAELAELGGTSDRAEAVRRLWHPGLRLMAVTRGAGGAELHAAGWRVAVGGFAVDVVDTVGCGDAFMAALLAGLLATDVAALDRAAATRLARRAVAAGAVMATRAGALGGMPEPAEIDRLLTVPEEAIT